MLKPTSEMLEEFKNHGDLSYTVTVTLQDNSTLTLTEEDLAQEGCVISRTSDSDSFPIGFVYCSQVSLEVFWKASLDGLNFYNATVSVSATYEYGENSTYTFSLGVYTITEQKTQADMIYLVGYDKVYSADVPIFSFGQTLPINATAAFEECCTHCGITFDKTYTFNDMACVPDGWDNCTIMLNEIPEDTTYRQLMGDIALIFGANAFISPFDNHLYVVAINTDTPSITFWGGYFDADTPYSSGSSLDGGSFNPWNTGDVDDGHFGEDTEIIYLDDPLEAPELALSNVVMGGVRIGDNSYGGGYQLTPELTFFENSAEQIANSAGAQVFGYTFRPFTLDYSTYPFADLMQNVQIVDQRYEIYRSVITSIEFNFKGVTTFACDAETPTQIISSYSSARTIAETAKSMAKDASSQATQSAQKAETDMNKLAALISQSFGVYETHSVASNGATTFYLHNKQTLAASDTIWRMSAGGYMVSTNGGVSWRAGMTSSGDAFLNILNAKGINADWIRTGTISSNDNRTYWDLDSGVIHTTSNSNGNTLRISDGLIRYYNSSSQLIYKMGKSTIQNIQGVGVSVAGYNTAFGYINEDETANVTIFINNDLTGQTTGFTYRNIIAGSTFIRDTLKLGNATISSVTFQRSNTNYKKQLYTSTESGFVFTIDGTSYWKNKSGTIHYRDEYYTAVVSVNGNFACSGEGFINEVTTMYINNLSDEREKNILDWDDRYDELIDNLTPILYTWKNGEDAREHVGFSAQKVQKSIADLDIENSGIVNEGSSLSLAYLEFIPLLVNKVKQQQKRIDELEARLARLEKIVEGL